MFPALIDFDAALLLLVVFAMLGQRRVGTLINLFALEGLLLAAASVLEGLVQARPELEEAALLTLVLKGLVLPWLLHRMRRVLAVRWDDESPAHSVGIHLLGLAVVVAAFAEAAPLVAGGAGRDLAMALAVVGLALLMMITRRTALAQVVGFLTLENGLFLAAASATGGMPLLVELGIAFDVLVVTVIFAVFFLHLQRRFDSLDLARLESLREE